MDHDLCLAELEVIVAPCPSDKAYRPYRAKLFVKLGRLEEAIGNESAGFKLEPTPLHVWFMVNRLKEAKRPNAAASLSGSAAAQESAIKPPRQ